MVAWVLGDGQCGGDARCGGYSSRGGNVDEEYEVES